jgi:hypothetical protein
MPELLDLETPDSSLAPKHVIGFGKNADERADASSRAPLEKAEREIESAKQKAEDLRIAIAARQERLEHLRRHRDKIATRLARIQKRDLAGWLTACEDIVDRLYESHELSDPARAVELNSAAVALGFIPKLQARAVIIAARLTKELAQANAELTALESEK